MRNNKKQDKYNYTDAEVDYRSGLLSVRAIAAKYGMPEPSLRQEARTRGWIRGLAATKRTMVSDVMAGGDMYGHATEEEVKKRQLIAAEQDLRDMNAGLNVARACIRALYNMVDETDNAKEIKYIVDANKAAIETIRKIRGLDDAPPPNPSSGVAALIAECNGTSLMPVG